VVVGVPEYGPWDVRPVTWLLTTGGTAAVAPGISDAGIPATETTDSTEALFTVGIWGYEYGPKGDASGGTKVGVAAAPTGETAATDAWVWPSLICVTTGVAAATGRKATAETIPVNILYKLEDVYGKENAWRDERGRCRSYRTTDTKVDQDLMQGTAGLWTSWLRLFLRIRDGSSKPCLNSDGVENHNQSAPYFPDVRISLRVVGTSAI